MDRTQPVFTFHEVTKMTETNADLIKKYEGERDLQIENINKDYDAKIAHVKKRKAVTGDNDIPVDNIETGEDVEPALVSNDDD